jgi:dTMP kinase
MVQPTFIVIEGIDGVGKTTQAKLILNELTNAGYATYLTNEPSHNEIGELCRIILKKEINPFIDALLFSADRLDHLNKEIYPHLDNDEIVISDRYFLSTYAYQLASNVDVKLRNGEIFYVHLDWLQELNKYAIVPDITIFIDCPIYIVLKRLHNIKTELEKFENKQHLLEIQHQYWNLILNPELAPTFSKNYICIDGGDTEEQVTADIMKELLPLLQQK